MGDEREGRNTVKVREQRDRNVKSYKISFYIPGKKKNVFAPLCE